MMVTKLRKFQANSEIKRRAEQAAIDGMTNGRSWETMLHDNLVFVRKYIGSRYGLRLAVVYNDSGTPRQLESILWKFDIQPPHNMALRPKYVAVCNDRLELIESLCISLTKLLEGKIYKDYKYRLTREFSSSNPKRIPEMVYEIKRHLTYARSTEDFITILNKIDFSLHTKNIIDQMKLPIRQEYGKTIYLKAENIVSVELIRFEPAYQIDLSMSEKRVSSPIRIPESIELSDSRVTLR